MEHTKSYFTVPVSRLLPVPPTSLRVREPVPVDLWSSRGTLLLSKNQILESEEQLEHLSGLHPLVKDPQFLELMLSNGDPEEVMSAAAPDALSGWPALHDRLQRLLRQPPPPGEFENRLDVLLAVSRRMLGAQRDKSLFMLVQMLYDADRGYNAMHALASAALCQLLGAQAGLSEWDVRSLACAALTMNVGMSAIQDALAHQAAPPDEAQRAAIAAHPETSSRLLRDWGVTDPLWLRLVETHHDGEAASDDPRTQPAVAWHLLWLVDQYVASISPRRSRCGLAPNGAARKMYLEMRQRDAALGNLLVRTLGIYPPGSYVRLQSGEIAVVVGRGPAAHQPRVFALVSKDGVHRQHPAERDTSAWPHAVVESIVIGGNYVLRLDLDRLFPQS